MENRLTFALGALYLLRMKERSNICLYVLMLNKLKNFDLTCPPQTVETYLQPPANPVLASVGGKRLLYFLPPIL